MIMRRLHEKRNHGFGSVRLIVGAVCVLAQASIGNWLLPIACAGADGHFSKCVYSVGEEKAFYENGEVVATLLKIMALKKTDAYDVRFEVADESGKQVAREEKHLELRAGWNVIPFLVDTQKTSAGDCQIQARVYRGAMLVEDKVIRLTVLDKTYLQAKLSRMERMSAGLRSTLDKAARQGIDISYPQTSWALSKLFERLIGTELATGKKEYAKLNWQMNDVLASMEKSNMLRQYCIQDLGNRYVKLLKRGMI